MTKRTEFKKRNIELYLKKNVFSGQFVVRNILVATLAVSTVAGIAGVTGLVANAIMSETKVATTELAVSDEVTADTTAKVAMADITYVETPELASDSIGTLFADLGFDETVDLASRKTEMLTYAPGEFDEKFVAIADDIDILSEASDSASVVGAVTKGVVGDIISVEGDWVYISSGDVKGYIKKYFILSGDEAGQYASAYYTVQATVNDNGVYVRSEASKDSDYVATANAGDSYAVADIQTKDAEWVKVDIGNNKTGYVYSQFIDVVSGYPVAVAKEDASLPAATGSIKELKADNKATGTITEKKQEVTVDKKTTESATTTATTETASKTETTTAATTTEAASAPTQVTTTARGSFSLSEDDIYLMACVLTLECGGEPYEGQVAVANVILNRLQSGRYGSTVADVVYAPNQFSVVGTDRFNTLLSGGAQSSCIQAAREACAGTNNVGSYSYFKPTRLADASAYSSYTIIGNHFFY